MAVVPTPLAASPLRRVPSCGEPRPGSSRSPVETFDIGLVTLGGDVCGLIGQLQPKSPKAPAWTAAPGWLPTIRMPLARTGTRQPGVTVPVTRPPIPWTQPCGQNEPRLTARPSMLPTGSLNAGTSRPRLPNWKTSRSPTGRRQPPGSDRPQTGTTAERGTTCRQALAGLPRAVISILRPRAVRSSSLMPGQQESRTKASRKLRLTFIGLLEGVPWTPRNRGCLTG